MNRPPIDEVLARHDDRLIAIDGVHGIYIGLGDDAEPCIKLMVSGLTDDLRALLPESLEGWPVVLEDGGPIRPMD